MENITIQQLMGEDRLSFEQLAERESISMSTVWRWYIKGVNKNKKKIKLGGFKIERLNAC